MTAERDQLMPRQNRLEAPFTLQERQFPQIFSTLKHEIECAVLQLRLLAERVLQQLKMRHAFLVERDKFAVDHGVAFYALERFRNFDVAMADDLAVAAVECDLTA